MNTANKIRISESTNVFENLFEAKEYAAEKRSYHFEVFNDEGDLVGFGVPK